MLLDDWPDDVDPPPLNDPVCGMPTNAESPHFCVRGGAMFFFCSETCRARFMANPMRFVVLNDPRRDAPAPVPKPAAAQDFHEAIRLSPEKQGARESGESGRETDRPPHGGLSRLIGSWLLPWRERHHAVRTSRELLALYRAVCAEHPDLTGRDLYKMVVMARNGCDSAAANEVLDCAEESFATWPVSRDLTFCDVVHYLSVSEFVATHEGDRWIHSDIEFVVASQIPHDLCVVHRYQEAANTQDVPS